MRILPLILLATLTFATGSGRVLAADSPRRPAGMTDEKIQSIYARWHGEQQRARRLPELDTTEADRQTAEAAGITSEELHAVITYVEETQRLEVEQLERFTKYRWITAGLLVVLNVPSYVLFAWGLGLHKAEAWSYERGDASPLAQWASARQIWLYCACVSIVVLQYMWLVRWLGIGEPP